MNVLHSLYKIPNVEKLQGAVNVRSQFKIQGKPQDNGMVNYDITRCEGSVELLDVMTKIVNDKRIFSSVNGMVYLRNNDAELMMSH